jgi:hypothetical protein
LFISLIPLNGPFVEELGLTLKNAFSQGPTVNEVMEILRIGKRVAFEVMDEEDFPCIKIGTKLKRVNRDDFFEWIQKKGLGS